MHYTRSFCHSLCELRSISRVVETCADDISSTRGSIVAPTKVLTRDLSDPLVRPSSMLDRSSFGGLFPSTLTGRRTRCMATGEPMSVCCYLLPPLRALCHRCCSREPLPVCHIFSCAAEVHGDSVHLFAHACGACRHAWRHVCTGMGVGS